MNYRSEEIEDIIEDIFYAVNIIREQKSLNKYERWKFYNNEYWFEWHENYDINFKICINEAMELLINNNKK